MSATDILMAAAGGDVLFTQSTITRVVTAGSGTLTPPVGAVGMRVAVVGAGATPSFSPNIYAGGGGCAASKIVPAASIAYTVGAASTFGNGENSTAVFPGYSLVGGGGVRSSVIAGTGGIGSGGDYNYNGGNAANNSGSGAGGGAAGPSGNGGAGMQNAPAAGSGWGVGGGGGANASGGGGGSGAPGSASTSTLGAPQGTTFFGGPGSISNGGVMGGGGGTNGYNGPGGVGGIVVEYFYTN